MNECKSYVYFLFCSWNSVVLNRNPYSTLSLFGMAYRIILSYLLSMCCMCLVTAILSLVFVPEANEDILSAKERLRRNMYSIVQCSPC